MSYHMRRKSSATFWRVIARFFRSWHNRSRSSNVLQATLPQTQIVHFVEQTQVTRTRATAIDSSVREFFTEEIAQTVAHQQLTQSVRKRSRQPLTVRRAVAWGGWATLMGIFAGSLLLNIPFGLGNYLLSQAPGSPRTATFFMEASEKFVHPGDAFTVAIKVDTNDALAGVSTSLSYDPHSVQVTAIAVDDSDFPQAKITKLDPATGKITIVREKNDGKVIGVGQVAVLHLTALPTIGTITLTFMPGEFDNYVYRTPTDTTYPKQLRNLAVSIDPQTVVPIVADAHRKTTAVTLDAAFEDWRDIIPYDLTSTITGGYAVGAKNLTAGSLRDDNDAGFTFTPGYFGRTLAMAFFIRDESRVDGDALQIKWGDHQASFPLFADSGDAAKTSTAQDFTLTVRQASFGYMAELTLPVSAFTATGFNVVQDDRDADGSFARLMVSSPQDSILNFR